MSLDSITDEFDSKYIPHNNSAFGQQLSSQLGDIEVNIVAARDY